MYLCYLLTFIRNGFLSASKMFKEDDLEVDCSGRHYMITGANSGIGKCIATEIAKRGGTVHMVCRNPSSAEEAKQDIIDASNNSNIFVHILDLSKPRDVHKFAQDFCKNNESLHVLVNNAGCMFNIRELTEDNLEKNFVTNTLGTYILTTQLLPLIKQSEKPRVVTVSSGGMLVQKLDYTDMQFEKMKPFDGTLAYAQNKRQQVWLTYFFIFPLHLSSSYTVLHFTCVSPGWADILLFAPMPDFYSKLKDKLRTPDEGADTAVWLAVSPAAVQHPAGLFFQDRNPAPTHLPLASTKVTTKEKEEFMTALEELSKKFAG
nr:dehydrogenase/reductase SDR family member 12-like isoform X2 [Cherax quadricarinatus]